MSSRQARTGPRIGSAIRRALAALPVAAVCWLAAPALAQPGAPPRTQPPAAKQAPTADQRAEIKRKVLAFRAYRLTVELRLDEAAAARVFPLLSKYDQQVEQLIVERLELNKALRQPVSDAKAADDLIRRTLINRRAFVELDEKRIAELRKVLSAEQTARLLVVLPEIERQIKSQIRRSMRQQDGEVLDPFEPRKRGRKARQRELDDFE